ncbi:unnamed protein product [Calypogeia fissa]
MTFNKVEPNGRPASKRLVSTVSRASDDTPLLLPGGNSHGGHFGSHHDGLSSVKKTFCNIVISVVGAGVLGMPYTFKQSGWLSGFLALAFVGLASYYNMMLLVKSKRKLESEGNDNVQSYSDLGFVAHGELGRTLVDVAIIISQGGFCVAYLIFIGENLASVVSSNGDQLQPNFVDSDQGALSYGSKGTIGINWQSKSIYVWLLFPFEAWLASIRSLTRLAPFSMFADIANVVAMGVVMSYDIIELKQEGVGTVHAFTGWGSLPFVLGVAIYAYEGFGLVIPIESHMKDRSKFSSTLAAALGFITTLFIVFAAFGYFAFGDSTQDIITLNLGQNWQTTVVKLALCFGLFFTFPVMMCPVHEVVERRFKGGRPSVFLRTITVLVVAITAVGVPNFGDFLSLLGSSVCSILSFIFPALFHLHTHSWDLRWWERLMDYILILFGVCFGIWGTWSALQNWG